MGPENFLRSITSLRDWSCFIADLVAYLKARSVALMPRSDLRRSCLFRFVISPPFQTRGSHQLPSVACWELASLVRPVACSLSWREDGTTAQALRLLCSRTLPPSAALRKKSGTSPRAVLRRASRASERNRETESSLPRDLPSALTAPPVHWTRLVLKVATLFAPAGSRPYLFPATASRRSSLREWTSHPAAFRIRLRAACAARLVAYGPAILSGSGCSSKTTNHSRHPGSSLGWRLRCV